MRALIIASVSGDSVMEPSSTWATNSFTRFLPRSFAAGSRASRPCSTIWSSRLVSACCSAVSGAAADGRCSFIGFPLQAHLRLQFRQLVLVADGVAKQFVELVVALQAPTQVREPL